MSKIIKNTSFYTIGNILPQAAGFFLLPIYTNYLSPSDYGIISSMQVLSSILLIFLTLAIDRSVYRMYFDYNTVELKKEYLGTITISLLLISILVLFLIFIFKNSVEKIFISVKFYPYYVFAILASFLSILQIVPKIYFQVNEKAEKFVFISLAQFLLNTTLALWFIINKNEGAAGMLKGELLSNLLITPIAIFISYKTIKLSFKLKIFFESIKFSIPLIPGLLSSFILNLSDRIFIERYFSLSEVGLYSLGYKIAGLIGVIGGSFLLAYGPVFYKYANSINQTEAKSIIAKYNHIYIIIVITISFLISFFSKEAIVILLNKKYGDSYKIIPIISFTYIIIQTTGLLNIMIYQSKKNIPLMLISIISAILSIGFNFLLIPHYGAFGAAFATLISFIIVLILTWRYAQICYYIPIKWREIVILLSFFSTIFYIFEYVFTFGLINTIIVKSLFVLTLATVLTFKNLKQIKAFFINE